MPAPQTDRRPDVIEWSKQHGWSWENAAWENEVIRDVFKKGEMELRCYWLHSPFSEALWARGYMLMPHRLVTVPRVTSSASRPSVESVLKLQHKLTKGM